MLIRLITVLLATTLAACQTIDKIIYRPDTSQGQVIDPCMLKKLHTGMSEKKVEIILGTSLVDQGEVKGKMYYVYYRYERFDDDILRHVTLTFKNGKLSKIEQDPKPAADEKLVCKV